jgi:hypothetical protein
LWKIALQDFTQKKKKVCAIGMNTRVGHIARMLGEKKKQDPNEKKKFDLLETCGFEIENNQTPLQESLQELGEQIGYSKTRNDPKVTVSLSKSWG